MGLCNWAILWNEFMNTTLIVYPLLLGCILAVICPRHSPLPHRASCNQATECFITAHAPKAQVTREHKHFVQSEQTVEADISVSGKSVLAPSV